MKIDYREVTIKKPVYIADDGKEFDNEEDCMDHEFDIFNESFRCFNSKYEKSNVETCAFVDVPTEKSVKHFIKVCDTLGITADGVDKPGIFMYSDYGNSWINLEDTLARFKEVLNNE